MLSANLLRCNTTVNSNPALQSCFCLHYFVHLCMFLHFISISNSVQYCPNCLQANDEMQIPMLPSTASFELFSERA